MKFDSLLSDIIATVIGGSILTLLLFIAKEWLFPFPNISGQWHFETHTVSTAYKPFSGMVLRYVAMIWQEGDVVHGSVEKVYERSSTGERSYVGKDRTRGTLEGRVHTVMYSLPPTITASEAEELFKNFSKSQLFSLPTPAAREQLRNPENGEMRPMDRLIEQARWAEIDNYYDDGKLGYKLEFDPEQNIAIESLFPSDAMSKGVEAETDRLGEPIPSEVRKLPLDNLLNEIHVKRMESDSQFEK